MTRPEVEVFEGAIRDAVKSAPSPPDVDRVIFTIENCLEPFAKSAGDRVSISLGMARDLFDHTANHDVARTRAAFLFSHELAHLVARSCLDENAIEVKCEMSADHLAVLWHKPAFRGGLEYLRHLADVAQQSMSDSPTLRHCVIASELALRGYMMASYMDWVYARTKLKDQEVIDFVRERATKFRSEVEHYQPLCSALLEGDSAQSDATETQVIAGRLAYVKAEVAKKYKDVPPETNLGQNIRGDYATFVQVEASFGTIFNDTFRSFETSEKAGVARLALTPWRSYPDMALGLAGGIARFSVARDGEDVPVESQWVGFLFRPPTLRLGRLDAGIQVDLVMTTDKLSSDKKFVSYVPHPHVFIGYTLTPEFRVTLGSFVRGTSLGYRWGGSLGLEYSFWPR